MLDLRGLYFSDRPEGEGSSEHGLSDLRFTTSLIVGNLGATLSTALEHSDTGTSTPAGPPVKQENPLPASVRMEDAGASVEDAARGDGSGAEEELWEWYEDEAVAYTLHPFRLGMAAEGPPVRSVELEMDLHAELTDPVRCPLVVV